MLHPGSDMDAFDDLLMSPSRRHQGGERLDDLFLRIPVGSDRGVGTGNKAHNLMVCANRPLRKPRTVRRHTLINGVVVHKGQGRPYFCNLVNFTSATAWDLITHHPRSSALEHTLLGKLEQAVVGTGFMVPLAQSRHFDVPLFQVFLTRIKIMFL